jgi:hypothetical protein
MLVYCDGTNAKEIESSWRLRGWMQRGSPAGIGKGEESVAVISLSRDRFKLPLREFIEI